MARLPEGNHFAPTPALTGESADAPQLDYLWLLTLYSFAMSLCLHSAASFRLSLISVWLGDFCARTDVVSCLTAKQGTLFREKNNITIYLMLTTIHNQSCNQLWLTLPYFQYVTSGGAMWSNLSSRHSRPHRPVGLVDLLVKEVTWRLETEGRALRFVGEKKGSSHFIDLFMGQSQGFVTWEEAAVFLSAQCFQIHELNHEYHHFLYYPAPDHKQPPFEKNPHLLTGTNLIRKQQPGPQKWLLPLKLK